jgi:hypothetical protein
MGRIPVRPAEKIELEKQTFGRLKKTIEEHPQLYLKDLREYEASVRDRFNDYLVNLRNSHIHKTPVFDPHKD